MKPDRFLAELKRRNIYKVATADACFDPALSVKMRCISAAV